ncbi:PhnD/SsuA/transferrin family substrate-binding protein [Neisseria sp. Dent CA1/247]|uniref:sensor histidine kinase n=1 Tax=Neisseria sp. Dent CA1/247 TaxID=2912675 RepID=UPI001FD0AFA1|nr:PhnD/SsuA/transferrin family substrate-binding protein [Neisseria sp. Dent CA1/247]UOO76083.1 PhnD/SsuA/transferrin family substrate-binding protein [Neisseria sp. Dent CA1/247]
MIIRLFFCITALFCATVSAKTWYVGVLAPQGAEAARSQWQPWLDWLGKKQEGEQFVLVPLSLNNWQKELSSQRIDFALGPQAQFVSLPDTQGWRWLATARFPSGHKPKAAEQVASTIWVRADSGLGSETDLRGLTVAAVDVQAFGGFMLAESALLEKGLRSGRDYQVVFTGYPVEQTLTALQNQEVDAAITPLCLMEEWRVQQGLPESSFKPLHVHSVVNNCISGTPVFPHWVLAALPSVPEQTASRIAASLMGSTAAAGMPSWSPPVSFVEAEQVLASLGRHPLHPNWQMQWKNWLYENTILVGAVALMLVISLINYGWMGWLAYRRRKKLEQAYRQLLERDRLLAHADRMNIAGEMAAGLAHELNQPMAAIHYYAEACLQLLEAGKQPESIRKALHNIIQTTERGSHIIRNLRQWSKTPEHVYTDARIEDILQHCADWLACQKHAPQLHWQNHSGLSSIRTVAGIVEQVLMNCLLNCQQQQAKRIDITVFRRPESEELVIRIEDDAGGFNQDILAQPFIPFRSTKSDGLGLGLVICDRLLRGIGGSITLANRSDDTAGARIEISLPERNTDA